LESKIDAENLSLAKRLAEVKLKPGVGHVKTPQASTAAAKDKSKVAEALENLKAFRSSEDRRIRSENFLLAKRIAEVKSVDSKSSVMKELEKYQSAREKFKEQNELKKPKISRIHLESAVSRKDLPADFETRVYKLDGFKNMDSMKKYGLDEDVNKEELEEMIWEMGFKDYDTSMRRFQAYEQQRKSRMLEERERNKSEEQKKFEEEQKKLEEQRKEDERLKREAEEALKKLEEEERRKRMKKKIDEYTRKS
jgi:hypothetical protein